MKKTFLILAGAVTHFQPRGLPDGKVSMKINIGCAGWSVPSSFAKSFAAEGSHLERYSSRFGCVEINSSFYRPHKPETYARWAESVPEHFLFSAKVPKVITHERRLRDAGEPLERFLGEVSNLGRKLGPVLVQLPPSLAFSPEVAGAFFALLRDKYSGAVVCEPRHASWFAPEAEGLLEHFQVARVAANPVLAPAAGLPAGWRRLAYFRLHGSPRVYSSPYPPEFLEALARSLNSSESDFCSAWIIFDNTAEGEATGNALDLAQMIQSQRP
jgi:uncharacterized protein YecE (DUF72 family)